MPGPSTVPEWLATALVGAVIAALGYVSKLILDAVFAWRRAGADRKARLLELASLLRASGAAFRKQNSLAVRLVEMLRSHHPDFKTQGLGLEQIISRFPGTLDGEEAELHQVIRGLTEHAVRPLNLRLSAWLRADREFRVTRRPGLTSDLAAALSHLDIHLTLWHAKYRAWMSDSRHALIYMADEEDHGTRFPSGLDSTVERMLRELGMTVVPHDGNSSTEPSDAGGD